MSDFSRAAQSRDTTSSLDIYSVTLEICEGYARSFGKIFISIKKYFLSGMPLFETSLGLVNTSTGSKHETDLTKTESRKSPASCPAHTLNFCYIYDL